MTQLTQKPTPAIHSLPKPPQAEGHWLLGNYPDFVDDTVGFLLDLYRNYGDVVRTRFFHWETYFVTHPDGIQHVLQGNHRNYSKRFIEYEKLQWIVGNGLLTSDGDFWLRQRRLIQPAFHRRRIAGFAAMMRDFTREMLAEWDKKEDGTAIDLDKEMMALTLRIVSQALFSFDSRREAEKVDEAFSFANEYVGVDASRPFANLWRRVPTPRNRRFEESIATLDAIVHRIIAERRQNPAAEEDLLGMLMAARDEETGKGMTDEQVRDEVMTLLLAGHETTANALTWTFYLLSQHPDAAAKLHEEIDAVLGKRPFTLDDLPNLTYTKIVIEESMRLYPPAYSIGRVADGDDAIMGYRIPAGTPVFMSSYVTHRRPDFWQEPERFDPERFTPERSEGRHRFAYFPFGGGPRLCIGENFALMEAQILLATIAQRYRLRHVPSHPVAMQPLITLRPRYGMEMTLHRRER